MKNYLLKVENVLIIIFQDNLTQYQGSKGHSATSDDWIWILLLLVPGCFLLVLLEKLVRSSWQCLFDDDFGRGHGALLLVVLGGNLTRHVTLARITLTFICNLIETLVRTRILSKLMDSAIVHHSMVWWHFENFGGGWSMSMAPFFFREAAKSMFLLPVSCFCLMSWFQNDFEVNVTLANTSLRSTNLVSLQYSK
jgi:hypothetical protein